MNRLSFIKRAYDHIADQDPVIVWAVFLTFIVIIVMLITWAMAFPVMPDQIPLFYSRPWGENQVGSLLQFTVLPSLVMLILFVNLIISMHLHPTQDILKRTLNISSFVISVLLLIAALKIILLFT